MAKKARTPAPPRRAQGPRQRPRGPRPRTDAPAADEQRNRLILYGVALAVPGAMDAGLGDVLFWGSLALGLVLAFVAAYPVNVWLVNTGRRSHGTHGAHGHH